jgi:chitinase
MKKGYKKSRPLGDMVVDGFDLDIENGIGAYNYLFLVEKLRQSFCD